MSIRCKVPVRLKGRRASDPIRFIDPPSRPNPFDLGPGQTLDSDVISGDTCNAAWVDAWDDWLHDPTVVPEFQPTAGIVNFSIQDGPDVLAFAGSLSTTFTVDFIAVLKPSDWYRVKFIELNMPWSSQDDLDPWRLILTFMEQDQDLIPGVAQVFLGVPFAYPGTQDIFISPSINEPAPPCPPNQFNFDTVDGVDSVTVHLKEELPADSNTAPPPIITPFTIDMIGVEGGRSVISPPLPVAEGP